MNNKDELLKKLTNFLSSTLDVDESRVSRSADLRNDLGLDSLDSMDLIFFIENEVGHSVDSKKVSELTDIQSILDLIEGQRHVE